MSPSRRSTLRASLLLACLLPGGMAVADGDPTGLWLTETRDSKVRIARCGAGYCGTVVAADDKGPDVNNPDPRQRARSVVGIQILSTPKAGRDGYVGTLYNPKDGKTYEASLKVGGSGQVVVTGCVMSVFCKGTTWTRTN